MCDILQHNGKDLRELPLLKRRSILHSVLKPNGFFAPVMQVDDKGEDVELGVPPKHKQAFYAIGKQLVTSEDKNFVYLEPRIRTKVKIRNWTQNGMLRTPSFVDFVF